VGLYDEDRRRLFGSVATYAPVHAEQGVAFARRALEEVIQPFVVGPEAKLRTFAVRQGEDLDAGLSVDGVPWDRVPQDAPLEDLTVTGWGRPMPDPDEWPAVLQVRVSGPTLTPLDIEFPTVLSFSVVRRHLPDSRVPAELQHRAVALLRDTFQGLEAAVGFLTIDFVSDTAHDESPYEDAVQIGPTMWDFRRYVRGYYWGNALGAAHVQALGGLDALRRAAVAEVQPLPGGGCWLQLTRDVNDIDRQRLAALRRLLTPVLPAGHQSLAEFPGEPPYLL
jgi:hypothetical protein